jgi:hypothetical protein
MNTVLKSAVSTINLYDITHLQYRIRAQNQNVA